MLLHAQEVEEMEESYGQREVGTAYRWKEYSVSFPNTELADFGC